MKTCTKCKVEKPEAEFNKDASKKDGLTSQCKSCAREYHMGNKDRIAAYKSERYKANPERFAEYQRKHRQANPEKIAAQKREYYKANPKKAAERSREWAKANPEKRSAHHRNRRSRKINAGGGHTAADILVIFESQRGLCANCQAKLFKSGKQKFHVDHIHPLSKGGSNDRYNLQCLCPKCNMSKHNKDPMKWANENGRLI